MVCRARGLDYVLHMLSRPINSLGRRGTHINSLTSGRKDGGVVWSTGWAPLAHPVLCFYRLCVSNKFSHFRKK